MQDASPAPYRTRSLAADRLGLTQRLSARTLLLGGVMIVMLGLLIGVEQDPDFWWHLRIGRWMLDNGRLPNQDVFTYTVTSHAWTDHEYLTEILMWLTYCTFGVTALVIAFGLLTWAGFWLIYMQVRRQPFVFVGVGLAIAAVAGAPIWGPRAQMITFVLSCLELYWLQGYLAGRSRAINFFPFLMMAGFALKRPTLYQFLLGTAGLFLALQSVRNIALFVAAATPVLITSYGGWWRDLATAHRWTFGIPPRRLFAVTTAVVLVGITLLTSIRVAGNISPAHQQNMDAQSYPVAASDWLAAHPEVGTRMFNQYGWGGYLANRFYPSPSRRVFIFGEAALMGDRLLNEYEDVVSLRSGWKQVLDRYGVDYVVYNKGAALSNVLATQSDWTLVYQDSVAVIYVRTASRS